MRKLYLGLFFSLITCSSFFLSAIIPGEAEKVTIQPLVQEIPENQILFNGRIWRNLYIRIRGDQFLFSKIFHQGTVTIGDKLFKNLEILYDIYNDEILIKTNKGIIMQLNKEMVSSFTMHFNNRTYDFIKLEKESQNGTKGYFNILYPDNISLFVQYKKVILLLAEEHKYDVFRQSHRIYVRKDGIMHPVKSRNDIISLFGDSKQEIRSFIKRNKIRISKNNPDSFVPVVGFCNSLR